MEKKLANDEQNFRDLIEKNRDNPKLVEIYERCLRSVRTDGPPQIIANSKRKVQGVYLIGGPWVGGDRLVEFRVRRGSEPEWGRPMALLLRRLGEGRQVSLVLDHQSRNAVASTRGAAAGIEEPHRLGRLQGVLLSIGDFPPDGLDTPLWSYELDTEWTPPEPGQVAVNVLVREENSVSRIARVVIAPSRGFVCPVIEEFDDYGRPLRSWTCEDYFRDDSSGLWFPVRCRHVFALPNRTDAEGSIDYEIDPLTTRLNVDLPAERFTIKVPPEFSVVSELTGETRSWQVRCEVLLGIDDLEGLSAQPCLSPTKVASAQSVRTPINPGWTPLGRILLWGNLAVLGGLFAYWLLRRRRGAALWIVLVPVVSGTLGCTDAFDPAEFRSTADSGAAPIQVEPARIDLGTLAADSGLVEWTLGLRNLDLTHSVVVEISSGCGCAKLETAHYRLAAGEFRRIPVQFTTYGRTGPVDASLRLHCSRSPSDGDACTIVVPITARLMRTVFAHPNRVVMNRSTESEELTGIVAVLAPQDEWQHLEIESSHPGIMLEVLETERGDEVEERRRFRVRAVSEVDLSTASLQVRRSGQELTVLSIPIVSGRPVNTLGGPGVEASPLADR